ncbi:DUF3566 domain-containing protein [Plantactinospora sp. WMMC1484]|uniref:DUF3566 domain-containing protein n=1 Tax=Plantactinospora sp. WMMC1484 TaxID=3404122 RepID=UPI003BF50291
MPPPPDQLPEEPAASSAGAAEGGSSASGTEEAGTAATSPAATGSASPVTGTSRSGQVGKADSTTTGRLEQPGSPDRTERLPGRSDRPGSAGSAGAESTQPISGGASPGAFRPGRAGGGAPSAGTSRFGLGGPAARPTTGAPGGAGAGAPGGPAGGAVGAARVTEAVRAARSTVSSAASRGPRRARLNLKRIDPWSVMKFSFAVSLVLFIVVIVATSVLYLALDAMGVFDSVNSTLTDMISASGGQGGDTFQITARGVILTSGLIGLVNVVLFTALATLGAFIYNVCADLVGGVELTLAERD